MIQEVLISVFFWLRLCSEVDLIDLKDSLNHFLKIYQLLRSLINYAKIKSFIFTVIYMLEKIFVISQNRDLTRIATIC